MPESWTFTIEDSPRAPPLETVGGITVALRSPKTDHSATVMINPAALGYEAAPETPAGVEVRHGMILGRGEETIVLELERGERQLYLRGSVAESMTLLRVGPVTFEGQDFREYEFRLERFDDDELQEEEFSPAFRAAALYNRGVGRRREGDLEGALEDFTRVIEDDDAREVEWAGALDNRARIWSDQGEYERADEDLTLIIDRQSIPAQYRARCLDSRAHVREQAGQIERARQDVETLLGMEDASEEQKGKAREFLERLDIE